MQPHMAQIIPSSVDPSALHYGGMMPQLTAQMSQLQLGSGSFVASPHPTYAPALYTQPATQRMQPMAVQDDPNNATSVPVSGAAGNPEDQQHHYQTYQASAK